MQEARTHLKEAELTGGGGRAERETTGYEPRAAGGGGSFGTSAGTERDATGYEPDRPDRSDLSEIRALVSSRIHDASCDLTLLHVNPNP